MKTDDGFGFKSKFFAEKTKPGRIGNPFAFSSSAANSLILDLSLGFGPDFSKS